jgi:hypothetical protein
MQPGRLLDPAGAFDRPETPMDLPCLATPAARRTGFASLALAVLLPLAARPDDATAGIAARAEAPAPEIVAEAHFLCDPMPPGGRDLNLSVVVEEGEPDPETGDASLVTFPRLQLAMALGDRWGLTADVGLAAGGGALDAPGASLKLLLRAPDAGRTGLAASLDLYGSTHSLVESEAGLGLGAIHSLGRVALRAGASLATGLSGWSPHLHAGVSAAVALGDRWRALAEVVTDVAGGEAVVSAGPTVKLALGERTALMAGALFQVGPDAAAPSFSFQLTQAI